MKKYLIASLLALTATFSIAAVGCKDENPSSGTETPSETFTVTINGDEGYKIVGEGVTYDKANDCWNATAYEGSVFTFSLDIGAFYTGIPTVTANNVAVSDSNGTYSVTIDKDTNIKISGIFKEVSAMSGSGAFDDAYVVSRPIDLVYIAEQVNAGNSNFARASYVLAADIDMKGEELTPIGTETNPFFGCFTCLTNSETGEMERFAISNFKISTTDKNYVGLFGCVQVDMSVSSSGLFYGIRITDFAINAATTNLQKGDSMLFCGGLIGYGIGTRAYLCDATNGTINISAAPSEFAFVGGLIGIQQSMYMTEYNQYYNAEVAYACVDVDVNIVSGTALYAGGITGYLATNSFGSPAYIHNSYSTGNVSGAIRSGGIAGGLGQYTSIATSYSTGNVTANTPLTTQADGFEKDYCMAFAGGIVGFAENDSVVNDSFALGNLTAKAVDGESAQFTHYAIGGGDEDGKVSVASRKYIVRNCLGELDKGTMATTLSDMGWHSYNWIISNTDYPTINYEASQESATVTVTAKFVDKTGNAVEVEKENHAEYAYSDTYAPIASAFVDGQIGLYYTSDDKKLISFGYYFDKACTDPVPYSFITTKSTELYIGFIDPSAVVGEYRLAVKDANKPLSVTIQKDGKIFCADGDTTTEAYYQYDGKTLIVEGARLARYFTGEVDDKQSVNEDTLFDMNRYNSYYFQAKQTEKGLELFDGKYFTAEKPLTAYKATAFNKLGAYYAVNGNTIDEYVFLPDGTATKNGKSLTYTYAENTITFNDTTKIGVNDLKAYDALKGDWQKTAFINKTFHFDGINGWKAYTVAYNRDMLNGSFAENRQNQVAGSYTSADGKTYVLKTENGDTYATATFDDNGFLSIVYANNEKETYHGESSFVGTWRNNDVILEMRGINAKGVGEATVTYRSLNVSYDLTYAYSETKNYLCLYYEDMPFGYFTHDTLYNVLQATLYDPTSSDSYLVNTLSLVNDLNSVWISNDEKFDNISFNGIGNYNANGDWVSTLTLNGETVNYTLKNGSMNGYFSYQGKQYTLHYNDITGIVLVDETTVLERKDTLAGIDFVSIDESGKISSFAFDGKGNLTAGGELNVTLAGKATTTYTYQSLGNNQYNIYNGNTIIGSIVKNSKNACYDITLNGKTYETYIRNEFIGNWALSGEYANNAFVIGATDLNGYIHANFLGESVKIEKLDTDFYSFFCKPNGMPTTYYLFVLKDSETGKFDSFALSEYASLVYNSYILCSYVDPMKGTWQQKGSSFSLSFDGVQSSYSNGTAILSYSGYNTPYFYRIYTDTNGNVESVMLWSQKAYNNNTLYYKLTPTAVTTEGAFVLGDKAYLRTEIDSLYKIEAKGADGYTYTFDGGNLDNDTWGKITATKAGAADRTLSYDIVSFNEDNTVTLTVKETVNGATKTFTATLDYSDNTNITITFVEQTA